MRIIMQYVYVCLLWHDQDASRWLLCCSKEATWKARLLWPIGQAGQAGSRCCNLDCVKCTSAWLAYVSQAVYLSTCPGYTTYRLSKLTASMPKCQGPTLPLQTRHASSSWDVQFLGDSDWSLGQDAWLFNISSHAKKDQKGCSPVHSISIFHIYIYTYISNPHIYIYIYILFPWLLWTFVAYSKHSLLSRCVQGHSRWLILILSPHNSRKLMVCRDCLPWRQYKTDLQKGLSTKKANASWQSAKASDRQHVITSEVSLIISEFDPVWSFWLILNRLGAVPEMHRTCGAISF